MSLINSSTVTDKTDKILTFPDFDNIKVSTRTFIVMTNLTIDLLKLFDFLNVTEYTIIPKKRGRKKKIPTTDPNKSIANGSIITLKYENRLKGVDLKQKKSQSQIKKKQGKYFRNSFTVVIILDGKPINFKICKNGMFQITGCKIEKHADECIKELWSLIKTEENNIYTFNSSNHLEALFIPAMRNIDFSIGFNVDREKLARYMSTQTEFHSLLETSFGYTGVNIKIPLENDISKLEIKKITYKDDTWIETNTTYEEYLHKLSDKDQQKKLNKERWNTFLVFHSGRCIMSGITSEFMRESYYYFLKIIKTCHKQIEEKLDI
jgi:TATA-box binding protein (TBP) (component of TFIID and TFIIIB)